MASRSSGWSIAVQPHPRCSSQGCPVYASQSGCGSTNAPDASVLQTTNVVAGTRKRYRWAPSWPATLAGVSELGRVYGLIRRERRFDDRRDPLIGSSEWYHAHRSGRQNVGECTSLAVLDRTEPMAPHPTARLVYHSEVYRVDIRADDRISI